MGRISVRVSRKNLIILLVLFFVILGGTGGYLLWRVNQEETVAPTESAAEHFKCYCCRSGGSEYDCEYPTASACQSCWGGYHMNDYHQCCKSLNEGCKKQGVWCMEEDFGNPIKDVGGTFRWGSLSCNYAWDC